MRDGDFWTVWEDALGSERGGFIHKWTHSTIWDVTENLSEDAAKTIEIQLENIWDVAHMSVKDICKMVGLTQAELAVRFCIPKRTVEDWCRGVSKCADYTRLMMAECLGILKVERSNIAGLYERT